MPGSHLKFLVVEDHPFQRAMLVQLLVSLGASSVQEAGDGAAALALLRDAAQPFDIVISDVAMPGMDGMELVRHLGELGTQVSLILASAVEPNLLATIANMARGYQVRLLGVVGKPATAAKLAPLLELHHMGVAAPETVVTGVPLQDLATSWTNLDFDPWFEPELDLASQTLRSLHAVPRWRHPERGSLGPEAFLPSVRARGLWEEFAWMLLERSLQACARWRRRGIQAEVSIPVHVEGWDKPELGARVTGAVKGLGLAPSQVVLFLSESALSSGSAAVLENLARLKLEGFSLGLADPASVVRIANAGGVFTRLRCPATLAATGRVPHVLAPARQAQLQICAYGVETQAVWQALKQGGCERASGPFIASAMQLDETVQWALLKAWKPGMQGPVT